MSPKNRKDIMNFTTLPVAKGVKINVGDFVFLDRQGYATPYSQNFLIRWIKKVIIIAERCFDARRDYTRFFSSFHLRSLIGICYRYSGQEKIEVIPNFTVTLEANKPLQISYY